MWGLIIVAIVPLCALALIICLATYKYHEHGRVECRWCGQWFDLYGDVDDDRCNWYEPVGEDLQGRCICRFIIGS